MLIINQINPISTQRNKRASFERGQEKLSVALVENLLREIQKTPDSFIVETKSTGLDSSLLRAYRSDQQIKIAITKSYGIETIQSITYKQGNTNFYECKKLYCEGLREIAWYAINALRR